jgi:hypothetical protein
MSKNRFLLFLSTCMLHIVLLQAQDANPSIQDSISGEKILSSIFSETEISKSYFYISLWGQRYRQAYATPVAAPIVDLAKYEGGLHIVEPWGPKNPRALLLADAKGNNYVLRALRKNPTAYLNNGALKQEYEEGELEDTYTADFIDDVGTGAHPYISLVVGSLARDLEIPHTHPSLIYVPRNGALGAFAQNYDGALYYIEKQIPSEMLSIDHTALNDTVVTTQKVLEQLRASASNKIDETGYIRARIFDMLIGDWNRNESQWDWLSSSTNGITVYAPISKNSDQAFSKMGDGPLMRLITYFSKKRRNLENYSGELVNPKWLNKSAFTLDKALISNLDASFWDSEAKKLKLALTDEVVEKAFSRVPQELDAGISEEIILNLKQRREQLPQLVSAYVKLLSKLVIIKGTDKNDRFTIVRKPNGRTKVTGQDKEGVGVPFYSNTIQKWDTDQVWIYGLDGDDSFEVLGAGAKQVPIYIFGGADNDSYDIKNEKDIRLYDFPSQATTLSSTRLKVNLIDEPEAGRYDQERLQRFSNKVRPLLGVNVDDGLRVGVESTFTDYGFQHTPFTQQHTLTAAFYFAASGFDLQYTGQWVHAIDQFDIGLDLQATSPNYTLNFFGFGNESSNPNEEDPDTFKLDYNRVRVQKFKVAPWVSYRDPYGYSLKTTLAYKSIVIEETNSRFIQTYYESSDSATKNSFVELAATAYYDDSIQDLIPFLDVLVTMIAGSTFNITETSNAVFANPKLDVGLPFDADERVKITSRLASYINFNNNIEFYQGASLGAETGLRGYRNQRFTGLNSFVQSSDLRVKLNRIQTKLIPVDIGVYGGFDYGRVWINNDASNDWKTSIGGGLFFDTSGVLVGNISAFSSEEGLRVAVRLGVGF